MKLDGKITISGDDWKKFEKFVKYKWGHELKIAVGKATGRSALYVLSEIRKRIHDKEYIPNTYWTARRKGYKSAAEATPLIESGTMIRDTLLAKRIKTWTWEVGAIQDQKSPRTGKAYKELIPIIHEGTTYTMKRGGKSVTIRIPARPFLRSVFEDSSVHVKIRKEWNVTIERILKKYGKL